MTQEELVLLEMFVEGARRRKTDYDSGEFNTHGQLNLTSVTGEFTFGILDILEKACAELRRTVGPALTG